MVVGRSDELGDDGIEGDKSRILAEGGRCVVVVVGPSLAQAPSARRQAHVRQLPMNFFMPPF